MGSRALEQESHESDGAPARLLLLWGILAGPFYLGIGLAQALLREGFDLARHPLSLLANGPAGWIQTANFILTGVMVLAATVGLQRALGAKSRVATWFLGGFGVSLILAGIFPADPVDGFPVGTPEGFPTSISPIGLAHFIVGMLGFLCLAVSTFGAALALRRRRPPLAWLSFLSGLVIIFGFFGGVALPLGILGIWIGVVAGWIWLALLSFGLRQISLSSRE